MKYIFLGVILALTVTGCSVTGPREAPSPGSWTRPFFASDSENLIAYYEWAHHLSAAQFAREYAAVRRAFDHTSSDFDRLRYAILLSIPDTETSDLPHALELIDPVAANAGSSLHSLAFLLQSQLNEQRRQLASTAELKQKLDALKALEKDMSQHGAGSK